MDAFCCLPAKECLQELQLGTMRIILHNASTNIDVFPYDHRPAQDSWARDWEGGNEVVRRSGKKSPSNGAVGHRRRL